MALGAPGMAWAQAADADPWEPWNRAMFAFNDSVDKAALEPIARGYRAITPRFFRTGVSNALGNLRAPVVLANDILQAEPARAGATAGRFAINSTLGVAGLFDVAARMGLERHDEDFGQTLGKWGVGSVPYLVLPLLGPSTLRDASGRIVDTAFDLLNYAEFDGDTETRAIRTGLTVLSGREAAIEPIENLRANSIDPYVSARTSYLILRQSAIENGRANVQDLPDFEEMTPPPAEAATDAPTLEPGKQY
jgi:phospholipid-binding lipoprotein MlaA